MCDNMAFIGWLTIPKPGFQKEKFDESGLIHWFCIYSFMHLDSLLFIDNKYSSKQILLFIIYLFQDYSLLSLAVRHGVSNKTRH